MGTIVVPIGTFLSNYCGFIIYKSSVGNTTIFGRTDTSGTAAPFDPNSGRRRFIGEGVGNSTYLGFSVFNTSSSALTTTLWNFTLCNYTSRGEPDENGEYTDGTGIYDEYSNGTRVSVTTNTMIPNFSNTGLYAADNSPNIYFGGKGGVTQQITGNYCEILIYNTNLSTSSREKIEGYLAWKWGIQISLPGSHPYYSGPPI